MTKFKFGDSDNKRIRRIVRELRKQDELKQNLATAVKGLKEIAMKSQDARGLGCCLCHYTAQEALERIKQGEEEKNDQKV